MVSVSLSDDELVLLDGQCAEKVQREVDAANRRQYMRARLTDTRPEIAGFVADVLTEAEQSGKLICRSERIRRCAVCETSAGYAKRTRSSRQGRKGDPNYSKPLHMNGVELADRFVRVTGRSTVGCCLNCWEEAKPILAHELQYVRAEIPESITGRPPRFKWHKNRKCGQCGWEGSDHEMGKLPALMGGNYPGECPKCGAENRPFSPTRIEITDGFTLVEQPAQQEGSN